MYKQNARLTNCRQVCQIWDVCYIHSSVQMVLFRFYIFLHISQYQFIRKNVFVQQEFNFTKRFFTHFYGQFLADDVFRKKVYLKVLQRIGNLIIFFMVTFGYQGVLPN